MHASGRQRAHQGGDGDQWDFCPTLIRKFEGTGFGLGTHINMIDRTKSRRSRARARALEAKHANRSRPASLVHANRSPARQFLIYLGWLRLFRAIAFESYVLPARPGARCRSCCGQTA